MKLSNNLLILLPIFILILTGCQGGNPTVPGSDLAQGQTPSRPEMSAQSHQLLGYYDLVIDKQGPAVELLPARTSDIHLNLTGIFNAFNSVGVVLQPGLSDPPTGLIVVDLIITHPFPLNPEFSAFDMKAILYSAGTLSAGGAIFSDADEPRVLNADGFTRWWNPTEFTNTGPFGYIVSNIPGSDAVDLTATVNPYKLFADVLGPEASLGDVANEPMTDPNGRAVFHEGSVNTRRMEISFPMSPTPQVIYGLGIDCSWDLPTPNPPMDVPNDFPIAANQLEAYRIHVNTLTEMLYYDSSVTKGGGFLEVEIFAWDWQGQQAGIVESEIASVNIYSPDMWSGAVPAVFANSTPTYARYTADLTGTVSPTHAGPTQVIIEVVSVDGTYDQVGQPAPPDPLASYMVVTLDVPEIICDGDSNNDWVEAVELFAGTPIVDQICDVGDYNDYFFFEIPANHLISGVLRMVCSAENVDLGLYDDDPTPNLIQEVTITGGSGEIPVGDMGLYPGTYNIWIHNSGSETAPYILELTGDIYDTEPLNPVDVTPDALYQEPWTVFNVGNYIIMPPFANSNLWWIYDGTNPSNPVLVSTFEYNYPGLPLFSFEGTDCYIGYYQLGGPDCFIDHIDFSDPLNPVLTSQVVQIIDAAFTPNWVGGLTHDDNFLYVSINDGINWWLVAYDRTDFTSYNFLAFPGLTGFANFMDIIDINAWPNTYLVTGTFNDNETLILDITDPIATGIIISTATTVSAGYLISGLTVKDDKALYIGLNGANNSCVKGTISPAGAFTPPIDEEILPGAPLSIDTHPTSDRAFICCALQGLVVCDFSVGLTLINNEPFYESTSGLVIKYVNPDLIYATLISWGFEVIDVSDIGNFQSLYHSMVSDNPMDIAITDDSQYMYVLDSDPFVSENAAVRTVDISDPAHAQIVAEYWINAGTFGPMCLEGDVLAITMLEGYRLINASNPLNLTTYYNAITPGYTYYNAAIWGDFLYTGYDTGAPPIMIQVWDISNPASPLAPFPGWAITFYPRDILFNNDTLYINRGLTVLSYDLSIDPYAPTGVGGTATVDFFERARIENDLLYLIDGFELVIMDISDPTLFTPVGNVAIPNTGVVPDQFDMGGLFGFTAASPMVHSFNVWPPATPSHVAEVSFTDFYEAKALEENDGFLYFADTNRGIRIYDLY